MDTRRFEKRMRALGFSHIPKAGRYYTLDGLHSVEGVFSHQRSGPDVGNPGISRRDTLRRAGELWTRLQDSDVGPNESANGNARLAGRARAG